MENQIVVNDYRQMDKILKEERAYLLNIVKKIKKAKCNVLLIQKSILRDAVNDLSLHFLKTVNILAVKDIERDEVEFICKVSNSLTDHPATKSLHLIFNNVQNSQLGASLSLTLTPSPKINLGQLNLSKSSNPSAPVQWRLPE